MMLNDLMVYIAEDYRASIMPDEDEIIGHLTNNCLLCETTIKEVDLENKTIYQRRVYQVGSRYFRFDFTVKYLDCIYEETVHLESITEVFIMAVTGVAYKEKTV